MRNGALVVVTAAAAMYQPQAQLLDLLGDVNLVHENGTRFVTNSAHIDVAADTAVGNDPVTGHGSSGDIAAQGFRVTDQGNMVFFTGRSNLLLKGSRPSTHASASPPGLPAPIAETAAALEAAAIADDRGVPDASVGAKAPAQAAPVAPQARPDATARSRNLAKRDGKLPVERSPVERSPVERSLGGRARPDAG
jgi:hypothetical protein